MALPSMDDVIKLAGALGLGGGAVKLLELLARRKMAERREPANMTRAAAELMDSLSDGGKELLDEFRTEFKYLRRRVVELQLDADVAKEEAAGAKEEAKGARGLVEELRTKHASCEAELVELRSKIDELMSGPVAGYGK